MTAEHAGLGGSVLVVENDDDLRALTVSSLIKAGYDAIGFARGAEAVERVRDRVPAVLLLDQKPRDMTVRQVLAALTDSGIRVPFIVTAGRSDERLAVEMMKLGASDYLIRDEDFPTNLPVALQRLFHAFSREQKLTGVTDRAWGSEEQLESIAASVPGVVYQFHAFPSGEYELAYVSKRVYDVFGLEHDTDSLFDELLARAHPGDRDAVMASIREAVATVSPWRYEWRFIKPSGEVLWVSGSSNPTRLPDRIVFNGLLLDVTDRKRAEEALRESEARNRALLDAIPDTMFVFDRDGRFVDFSTSGPGTLLQPPEFFLGKNVSEVLPPELARQTAERLKKVFQTREPQFFEYHLPVDRDLRHYEARLVSCGEDGVLSIVRDITERRRAEEGLLRQAALRDLLMEISATWLNLPLEQFETAIRDSLAHMGTFVDADRAYIFDYHFQRGICTNTYEWCDEGITPQIEELQAIPLEGIPDWVETHRQGNPMYVPDTFALPTGGVRSIIEPQGIKSLLTVPLMNGDECIGFVGFDSVHRHHAYSEVEQRLLMVFAQMLVNIRLRQQSWAEHERLQGLLLQAQKMESVGRLAGGVAHDFNNMLSVILGHAELALLRINAGQDVHADLHSIRKAAQRSADLTRQLLAFARKQVISPRVLDLNQTLQALLTMLQRLIGEGIDLVWSPTPGLWPVKLDPSQVDQILANLCVNARDAISGVGRISIEAANTTLDDDQCAGFSDAVPGEYVALSVSDTGCGMDKRAIDHLFEPFFTTKPVGEGTGLGLSTVYGIVKQNKGFVSVASEPGSGTIFTILLPRHQGEMPQASDQTPHPAPPGGSETILLVEDEPSILEVVAMMLKGLGYAVLAAGTPGEALRLAGEHSGPIDLLITDVVMPEMNGRDLAANLLSTHPDMKRLFVSGYTANVIAQQGVLDEGMHFLQKPFSMRELAAKIRQIL